MSDMILTEEQFEEAVLAASRRELLRVKRAADRAIAKAHASGIEEGRREVNLMLKGMTLLNGHGPQAVRALGRFMKAEDESEDQPSSPSLPPDLAEAYEAAAYDLTIEAKENDEDPAPRLAALAALLDDPEVLASALGDLDSDTVAKAVGQVILLKGNWDESKHPRSKDGRFISKDAIADAKSDPAKADALRARVKPEDAEKLEDALSGKTDLGRTKKGEAKEGAKQRAKSKEERLARVKAIRIAIGDRKHTKEDLLELAEHLPHLSIAELRKTRERMAQDGAGFGGAKRKEAMVAALVEHAKRIAGETDEEQAEVETEEETEEIDRSPERMRSLLVSRDVAGIRELFRTGHEGLDARNDAKSDGEILADAAGYYFDRYLNRDGVKLAEMMGIDPDPDGRDFASLLKVQRELARGTKRIAGEQAAEEASEAKPSSASRLHSAIDSADLSDEQKEKYRDAVTRATERMPEAVHERIGKNLSGVTFHGDNAAMSLAAIAEARKTPGLTAEDHRWLDGLEQQVKDGSMPMGGAYLNHSRTLQLDGDFSSQAGTSEHLPDSPIHQLYAHELGHAIDGPDYELSNTPEWQDAMGEVAGLTEYAGTDPSEGFAEFARLLYASDMPREQIEETFPKASKFFRDRGLWAEEPGKSKMGEVFSSKVPLGTDGSHIDQIDPLDFASLTDFQGEGDAGPRSRDPEQAATFEDAQEEMRRREAAERSIERGASPAAKEPHEMTRSEYLSAKRSDDAEAKYGNVPDPAMKPGTVAIIDGQKVVLSGEKSFDRRGMETEESNAARRKKPREVQYNIADNPDPYTGTGLITTADKWHEGVIAAALAAGKPVPPEVLADYPDLQSRSPASGPRDIPLDRAEGLGTLDGAKEEAPVVPLAARLKAAAETILEPPGPDESPLVEEGASSYPIIKRGYERAYRMMQEVAKLPDDEQKALAKEITGRSGATAKTAQKYIEDHLVGSVRALENQESGWGPDTGNHPQFTKQRKPNNSSKNPPTPVDNRTTSADTTSTAEPGKSPGGGAEGGKVTSNATHDRLIGEMQQAWSANQSKDRPSDAIMRTLVAAHEIRSKPITAKFGPHEGKQIVKVYYKPLVQGSATANGASLHLASGGGREDWVPVEQVEQWKRNGQDLLGTDVSVKDFLDIDDRDDLSDRAIDAKLPRGVYPNGGQS